MNEILTIPTDLVGIVLLGLVLGEVYAYILRPLAHVYNPHWTWVTVMVGVIITWFLFVLLAARNYVTWASVGWFVVVFCLIGFGILRWQLLQVRAHLQRQKAKNGNGPQDAGRGRGPGSAA